MAPTRIVEAIDILEDGGLSEAFRLMEGRDQLRAVKLEQLRQDVREGLESGSTGELDIAAIKLRGRERLKKLKQG